MYLETLQQVKLFSEIEHSTEIIYSHVSTKAAEFAL